MEQIEGTVLFTAILVASLVILCFQRRLLDALIEAIDNFRGGPPTAMHPSPSDDGALLRRKSRKSALPLEPLNPNAESVAAMKAARRGELVEVGKPDRLLQTLNARAGGTPD
jgi:DNA-damage-inducible protein J